MSSSSAAAAAAAAADSSSAARKVPPPCWTREETVELIKAYRDKWFAVNRGNLRAADWDAVAAALADSPAPSDPPKSAVQCRHKIEKIRKRYRAEKQRCANFPGRFFSSWDLFPLLDAMEIGSIGTKQEQDVEKSSGGGDPPSERHQLDPDLEFDPDLAYRARKFSKVNGGGYGEAIDFDNREDQNSVSVAFMPKEYGRFDRKLGGNSSNFGFDTEYGSGGYGRKPSGKLERDDLMNGKKIAEEWGGAGSVSSSRVRVKSHPYHSSSQPDRNSNGGLFPNGKMNGSGGGLADDGAARKDPVAEVVSAIKMLREGFVMVEEMKMDMAMEIEKMRMGMELKHNQMLLEMQQDIVEAFAKAYEKKKTKKKNKKRKVDVMMSPNSNRNGGDSEVAATDFEAID
ncbi:unnamed protein product [Linum tenue]|uniref:Myb-like domain-containing protein n=1 Tax=Linum tenue TaxID=586396 RepID=A0AAV0K6U6_9ROSI|nr:unnamed protein product [Linum tenue]